MSWKQGGSGPHAGPVLVRPVVPPGPARRPRDRGPREGCCRRRCDDVTALAIARAMPDVAEA